jgi:hypothetical protein
LHETRNDDFSGRSRIHESFGKRKIAVFATTRYAPTQRNSFEAHNPVDWFPWGEEGFAKARNEQKPIFLSVGYSTCQYDPLLRFMGAVGAT